MVTEKKINKKERRLAILSALYLKKQQFIFVDNNSFTEFSGLKTKTIVNTIKTLGLKPSEKILFILPEPNKDFWLASRNLKNIEVKQTLNTGSSKYPITYKLRKNKNNSWSIVNIIVNGVNLGLTFRNQFQALAIKNSGDIEDTLEGWVSDAGDAGISG